MLLSLRLFKNQALWLYAALIIGISNAVISPISKMILEHGTFYTLSLFGGISLIVWFAIGSSIYLIHKHIHNLCLSIIDNCICVLCITLCCIPSYLISWVSLCGLAFYFLIHNRKNTRLYSGFFLLFFVALRIPLIQFCMSVFSSPLLNFDAFLVTKFLYFFDPLVFAQDNIIHTSKSYSLAIMTGCSSFDNMSLAIILWLTLIQLKGGINRFSMLYHSVILATSVVVINISRLSMMAMYKNLYEFFHADFGLMVLEIIILSTAYLVASIPGGNRNLA